jgi:hypothetical protein
VVSLLALALVAAAQDVRVEANVSAQRVGIEDVLELTVSISGGEADFDPELPDLDGFRVGGRSTSSQIQIVNGRMSSTYAYVYQLLPQKEGSFTIGAVTVTSGGEAHRTRPIDVEVVSGSVVPRRPRGFGSPFDPLGGMPSRRPAPQVQSDDVFVRAEVSKQSVYQGEQLVLTYWLYSPYVPLGIQVEDDPPLSGFWVEEVEPSPNRTGERRTVGGKPVIAFPVKTRVLFPTSSGNLAVPPLTLSTSFRLTTGDPFDAFFARSSEPITVRSQPISIQVSALPEAGRAPEFSGAVGDYELEANLNKNQVNAGDPVTLTLAIAGRGNLRSVEAPELPELKGFRRFDPKMAEKSRAGPSGFEGEKSWEYVLVPESGGVKEIGPWRFQYFDPKAKKYVTASVGPLTLEVEGGTATAADAGASTDLAPREITVLRKDIRFLKPAPSTLGESANPFHRSPIFYGSLLLPVLWNLGLILYIRRREKEKTESHLFRSRKAHRMARARLKTAAKLAASGSKAFYEEVAAALYRYVGDKSSTSPSGLTPSSIGATLEAHGITAPLREEFREVLARCEEARFTPGERTRREMESLRSRTEELIVAIERQWTA